MPERGWWQVITSALFVSLKSFTRHVKRHNRMIAISILADDEGAPPWLGGCAGAIRLQFDDDSEESLGLQSGDLPDLHRRHEEGVRLMVGDVELFDFNDALKILRFLNHYAAKQDAYELVVHCKAGISRSAAVAQFCADKYGARLDGANPDTSGANPRMLRLLNAAAADCQPVIGELPIGHGLPEA